MSDKTKENPTAATSNIKDQKQDKKEYSNKEKEQASTSKYKPREPKGKKPLNKTKSKEEEEATDKSKPKDEAKSKIKHDKLLRRSKRINQKVQELEKLDKKDICKKKSNLTNFKAVKDTVAAKQKQAIKERINRNKDLVDTVFHKMEVEVDHRDQTVVQKEPEPVIELKYQKIGDVEELIKQMEKDVLELMHKVFQLYKPDEILLSFNGGKDCTVVLHMLNKFFQSNSCLKHIKIPTLYITDPDAFEEIDEFVEDCEKLYNIQLIKKKGPIKEALKILCQENDKIKAVFMGCRRTDPYCQDLKNMQMTDPGWPALMRINPILDWKCRQVWEYIYLYNVPYCILYQKGYTSLGNKNNTKPNPYLRLINASTGEVLDYRPGHELLDNDELERAGRF